MQVQVQVQSKSSVLTGRLSKSDLITVVLALPALQAARRGKGSPYQ